MSSSLIGARLHSANVMSAIAEDVDFASEVLSKVYYLSDALVVGGESIISGVPDTNDAASIFLKSTEIGTRNVLIACWMPRHSLLDLCRSGIDDLNDLLMHGGLDIIDVYFLDSAGIVSFRGMGLL